jgi:hypothetical protein
MKKALIILTGLTLVMSLAGCSTSSESYKLGFSEGLQVANPVNGLRASGVEIACRNIWFIDRITYSGLVESEFLEGCYDAWMSLSDLYGE